MTLDTARVRRYLKGFDFESLFIEELGWGHYTTSLDVEVVEQRFTLQAVAEKRGVVAFTCAVGTIPPYATRRKIDGQPHGHEVAVLQSSRPMKSGSRIPFTGWQLRSRGTLCHGGAGQQPFSRRRPS